MTATRAKARSTRVLRLAKWAFDVDANDERYERRWCACCGAETSMANGAAVVNEDGDICCGGCR